MIRARIQIEDGPVRDTYMGWGFIVMGQSHRFAAPEKPRDTSSYVWEPGENQDPRTVAAPFDYTIKFLVEAPNRRLQNANARIAAWNAAVRQTTAGSAVRRCRTVTLYDDRMRCRIVGTPEIIESADDDDFYRMQDGSVLDCVVVELKIHVSHPELCDFDCATPRVFFPSELEAGMPVRGVRLAASDVAAEASAQVAEAERLVRAAGAPGWAAGARFAMALVSGNGLLVDAEGAHIYESKSEGLTLLLNPDGTPAPAYSSDGAALQAQLRKLCGVVEYLSGAERTAADGMMTFTVDD